LSETLDDLGKTLLGISGLLVKEGILFHITGGLASSYYGEPRFTQDVDIVIRIDPTSSTFDRLITALADRYIVDEQTARAAAAEGLLQALDRETLIKIDLHVGEAIAGELQRSVREEVLTGVFVPLVSREDAILSKLLWIRQGSHKSRHDVTAMLRRTGTLNWSFLSEKAQELEVDSLLAECSQPDAS
jgi:hypothetical protein